MGPLYGIFKRAVIWKLKDGKAMGGDGFPSEVWKYGGKLLMWIWKLCNRVRKREFRANREKELQ